MRSWLWLVVLVGPVAAQPPLECSKQQLDGYEPSKKEVVSHRRFALPDISYPVGAGPGVSWGVTLTARVSDSGQVVCYQLKLPLDSEPADLNRWRRAFLDRVTSWSYAPFTRNGRPVAAIVSEEINEHEIVSRHMPLPTVPLKQVHIVLERTECFGSCPVYHVELFGDGRAIYEGSDYVDVVGRHAYRVRPEVVARLVDSLRDKDLWSLRSEYWGSMTDSPTYYLTLRLGTHEHHITDYMGQDAGMPAAVSDFEQEVDQAADTGLWINLSSQALDRLEAEHFDFHSPEAAALLYRAVANEHGHDAQAMLRLVTLGAPVEGGAPSPDIGHLGRPTEPLFMLALLNQRVELLDALIARGALQTAGRPDQAKIDTAFRAAIVGGRLAPVRKIWDIEGDRPHPSLTFGDVTPVTLLLWHLKDDERAWEGRAIAEWLAAKGCDLDAVGPDGTTLRDIALRAGDTDFVEFLRAHAAHATTAVRSPRG